MATAKKTSCVLNDETEENSYGFTTATDGIVLERFIDNPVMLNSHNNTNEDVIGRWENIRTENGTLQADPVFDTDDEASAKIAGKYDRGFIKGVSMGLGFYIEDMKYIAGKLILTKCVLKEASIVAIPSNAKALKLYDLSTGKRYEPEQLELSLSAMKSDIDLSKNQNENMKQILLSASALVALGLTGQPQDEAQLDGQILKLKADSENAKAKVITLTADLEASEKKLSDHVKLQSKSLLDNAVSEGKITTEDRASFEAMPLEAVSLMLSKIPAKTSLSATLTGGKVANLAEPTTFDELMALSDEAKLSFKNSNPTKYNALLSA